ncbi:MAG: hypothetical protein ACLFTK_14340 [Anaerolineales bacterium]
MQNSTLPPVWTPVPSLTPSHTPTTTPSPTPTRTPSPTSTLSQVAVCAIFAVTGAPQPDISVAYNDVIGFSWENAPPDSRVILELVWEANPEPFIFDFSPERGFYSFLPLELLPGWGDYTWRLSLFLPPYGEICASAAEGAFFREPWWQRPLPNPLAPYLGG